MIRNILVGGAAVLAMVSVFATRAPDAYGKTPQTKEGVVCKLKCVRAHQDEISACAKAKCHDECTKEKSKDKALKAVCNSCVNRCIDPFRKELNACQEKCPV
ncbi:MAG TPA: hypothetical protein VNO21_05365 [Polyangiaceae bacterium]|nr:hypothetical protein [Polyangiaceae bacterium]